LQKIEVRVLWSGLFGIFILDSANRLGTDGTLEDVVVALVELYLKSRRPPAA